MKISALMMLPEVSWSVPIDSPAHGDPILEQLIEKLKKGDLKVFERIIAYTQKKSFAYIYHIIGDYHQAQDILQEAYIRVYCDIQKLRNPNSFRAWFLRIILNLSRDYLRFRKKCQLFKDPLSIENISVEEGSHSQNTIIANESAREILKYLSVPDQHILLLREFYQFTYKEISTALSMPVGTIKSRLHKAKKKLVDLVVKD